MTLVFLLVTIIASIIAFNNPQFKSKGLLNPYMVHHRKQYFRIISSGFLHADFFHLFVNMLVLFSFGPLVESYYDFHFDEKANYYYSILFLGGIVVANAPSIAKHKDNPYYNSLGASGAVASIIFASILFAPWNPIYLFGLIRIPGILMGILYLFYEYKMRDQQTGINHDAHFAGAIFGVVFTIILKPKIFLSFLDSLLNPGS